MLNKINVLAILITAVFLCQGQGIYAKNAGTKVARSVGNARGMGSELWTAPSNIGSRNLFYASGGERYRPGKSLTFIKEDLGGTNPKFDVRDEQGVRWKVKLGPEVQPETVASRLLWAVGYYVDEDYFLEASRISGLPAHLRRGQEFIGADGTIRGLRLKRDEKDRKKIGFWSWRNSPFSWTREFNGLRVMMALINNWDLKDENNAIYEESGKKIYEISDLGASFGTSGVLVIKSTAKGNLNAYRNSKFITKVTDSYVDFASPSLPSLPYIFDAWHYGLRARLRWIGRSVDRADAKWIGQLLAQLSQQQIRDAFRAGGYSPDDTAVFVQTLDARIKQLNAL